MIFKLCHIWKMRDNRETTSEKSQNWAKLLQVRPKFASIFWIVSLLWPTSPLPTASELRGTWSCRWVLEQAARCAPAAAARSGFRPARLLCCWFGGRDENTSGKLENELDRIGIQLIYTALFKIYTPIIVSFQEIWILRSLASFHEITQVDGISSNIYWFVHVDLHFLEKWIRLIFECLNSIFPNPIHLL